MAHFYSMVSASNDIWIGTSVFAQISRVSQQQPTQTHSAFVQTTLDHAFCGTTFIVTPPPIGQRSIVMSVSVCLCLCRLLLRHTADLCKHGCTDRDIVGGRNHAIEMGHIGAN